MPVRVLVIDDQRIMVEKLRQMLASEISWVVHGVTDGKLALDEALEFRPTVILQDLIMPETGGLDLIRLFRERRELMDVPVIVLSALDAPELKRTCFENGANDYLVKLPERIELLARIRYHCGAYQKGVERDEALHLLKVSQKQLASANLELQRQNGQDGLTGIANRRNFDDILHKEWQRGSRNGRPLSVLMCDVDYFKQYNDCYGHLAGDLCLQKVAAALTGNLKRPGDVAARYGGEEFSLVLPDTDLNGAAAVAENCRAHLERLAIPSSAAENGAVVTISVGVASVVPTMASSALTLLQRADIALYEAKTSGRNRVCLNR